MNPNASSQLEGQNVDDIPRLHLHILNIDFHRPLLSGLFLLLIPKLVRIVQFVVFVV